MDKPTNKQWKLFCERIVETNGNPSTKDAKECGIPFGYWFEIATRCNREKLIESAKEVIKRLDKEE